MASTLIHCKVCLRKMPIISWDSHVKGKKHQFCIPDFITVKGTFDAADVEEIHSYFSKYGIIQQKTFKIFPDYSTIVYQFKDKNAHFKIILDTHYVLGKELEILFTQKSLAGLSKQPPMVPGPSQKANPSIFGTQGPKAATSSVQQTPAGTINPLESLSQDCQTPLINALKSEKTFYRQVETLINRLQFDSTLLEVNRRLINDDLQAALSFVHRNCKIHFFGSSLTGLAFQGSDFDIYIENIGKPFESELAVLKKIKMLISKSRAFPDVLLIGGAAVPIIRCVHRKTNMKCDINIKSMLPIYNSHLIHFYLSLNDKVKRLMVLVKFWMERGGVKKVNCFSSYAIYMLVIFFLQQEPYNFPCVLDLQRSCVPNLQNGWNCGFTAAQTNYSNQAMNNATILDLFTNFVKFYYEFDYISYVVCPFMGKAMKKIDFVQPCNLPDCYEYYKTFSMKVQNCFNIKSSICIQDPFEHSRNVAASVNLPTVGRFIAMCKSALNLISKGQNLLLFNLLIRPVDAPFGTEVSFDVSKSQSAITDDQWIDGVKTIILKTLRDIMHFQISDIPAPSAVFPIPKDNVGSVAYNCTSEVNIWENRLHIIKNLIPQLPPTIEPIDLEVAATTCIVKYFQEASSTKLTFGMIFFKSPCRARIIIKSTGKCKNFIHECHFMKVNLPLWIKSAEDKILGALMQQESEIGNAIVKQEEVKAATDDVMAKNNAIKQEITEPPVDSNKDIVEENITHPSNVRTETPPEDPSAAKPPEFSPKVNEEVSESNRSKEQIEEQELVDDQAENEQDDEEDVPPDFFDDFMDKDFMDGLDIVDAWDEDSAPAQDPSEPISTEMDKVEKEEKSPAKLDGKDGKSSSEKPAQRSSEKCRRSKSPMKRRKRNRSNSSERNKQRSRSRDRARRDPEKTKRDINRDKIKCAKDKEMKIVSDKLRIVETGLVPPGTEMDVDLSTIPKRSVETDEQVRQPSTNSKRDRRNSRRSSSRDLRKSKHSRSPRKSRSPVYRPRHRERNDTTYRSKRRSGSAHSNLSERELWIRSSRKRSRSRDSPSRSKMRKHEEKKKKSFLEEIREKLNEVRPLPTPAIVQYPHTLYPAPVPVPVPAPNQFFGPNPTGMQQYDQSFFIGDNNYQSRHPTMSAGFNVMGSTGMASPSLPTPTTPIPNPQFPIVAMSKSQDLGKNECVKSTKEVRNDESSDVGKLFADKKISLSDFLAITAKPEVQSSTPEHLQKKVKVISRCQDVIKMMSDDRKFTGRLQVKSSLEPKSKVDVKYQSPLRRIPVVRFQFTSPVKISEEVDSFAVALDKVLQKVGLIQGTINLDDCGERKGIGKHAFVDEDATSLAIKATFLAATTMKKNNEVAVCAECTKRKLIVYSDVGTQCADDKTTNTVAIQVSEEDLNPVKGLPKKESLAALTPAQLLGKEKEVPLTTSEVTKSTEARSTAPVKNDHPKSIPRPRNTYRPAFRERREDYDEELEYYARIRPDLIETFGRRLGPRVYPTRGPASFHDTPPLMPLMRPLDEEDPQFFMDFNESFRGRNPNYSRFGSRY